MADRSPLGVLDDMLDETRGKLSSGGAAGDLWSDPSEDATARAFAGAQAGQIVFDHTANTWHVWKNRRWAQDARNRVFNDAREFVRTLKGALADPPAELGRIKFVSAVERACRSDPRLAVSHEVWDTDRWLLGVPGGVVDLRTGEVLEPRPELYISRQASVAPAPDGTPTPHWDRFLDEATRGDKEFQAFLQRMCGYALTGDVTEEVVLFVHGPGGNGKGVLLGAMTAIFGEYAVSVPKEVFTADAHINHEYYRAQMYGARLVTCSETEAQATWAESQIKELTGNETPISARHPYGKPFTYHFTGKLVIVGNFQPRLKGRSPAMERRLRVVPFTVKPAKADPELKEKLRPEYPGILRWMVNGCLAWRRERLGTCGVVSAATGAYFEKHDYLRQWVEERCVLDQTLRMEPAPLLRDFNRWAKGAGVEEVDMNSFSELLDHAAAEMRLTRVRNKGRRCVRGIGLKPDGLSGADRAAGEGYESGGDGPPF